MKKLYYIALVCVSVFTFQGCINSSSYNEMTDSEDKWIMEQYEKGFITKDQARELMFQRLNDNVKCRSRSE